MALSRRVLMSLIDSLDIMISPYDESDLVENRYILHNNGTISYQEDEKLARNTIQNSSMKPALISNKIPAKGFCILPNRVYYLTAKEDVASTKYSCSVAPHRDLTAYGLNVTTDANINFNCPGAVTMMITSIQPVMIYPNQVLAECYFSPADDGGAQVPIGGIIMWTGDALPYGYRVCDGQYGTPDLREKFIVGANYGYDAEMDTYNPGTLSTGGQNEVTLGIENLPAHHHAITTKETTVGKESTEITYVTDVTSTSPEPDPEGTEGDEAPSTEIIITRETTEVVTTVDPDEQMVVGNTEDAGANVAFDNRPVFQSLIFIMRYL